MTSTPWVVATEPTLLDRAIFNDQGLIPAIAQTPPLAQC